MAVPVRDLDADPVERSVLGPALTLLPVYGYARLLADGFHPATPGEFRLKPGVGIPPVHGQGDLWDDMFLGAVHTAPPSGRPIPLCPPPPDEPRPADLPDWYPCNWWPRGS